MKHILCLLILLGVSGTLSAQNSGYDRFLQEQSADFAEFAEKEDADFQKFRKKRNVEFASFLSENWEEFHEYEGMEPPLRMEPIKPIIKLSDVPKSPPVKLPVLNVRRIPSAPEPTIKEIPIVIPRHSEFLFYFYNASCHVHLDEELRFSLKGISEKELSDLWSLLSNGEYDAMIADCMRLRLNLRLCDWAYVQLVGEMATSFLRVSKKNETVFLQTYVLTQSGYDARMVRKGNRLVLLLQSDSEIYKKNFLRIDGKKYFMINEPDIDEAIYSYKIKFFDQAQSCSMEIKDKINLPITLTDSRAFVAKQYNFLSVSTTVNKNLMDFYNDYPFCDWKLYAIAPMSKELEDSLYPVIKQNITGKREVEAANILINFVQTGFNYKTDNEQFGSERTFFADELFYYPYSDCEDRAVLFSTLVKKLLNLDVVLLHYPNHIATAVNFKEDVSGDYIMVADRKYIICDPTYINASIGEAMPKFRNVKAEVIELK